MSGAGPAHGAASGFLHGILPAIKRFYPDKEKRGEAMTRHTTWYNCTLNLSTFIMGLVAAMERENSEHDDFDTSSISAVKAALMGPLSGIGDGFFWGVMRVVAAGIAMSLAAHGSIAAPFVFLLIYNIPSFFVRYKLTFLGYTVGTGFLKEVYDSGAIKILTKAAGVLGLFVLGAMTANTVNFSTTLAIPVDGGEAVAIQPYIDEMFMGLIPLALTLGCFWLMKKKNASVLAVMGAVLALSILMAIWELCEKLA